VKIRKPRLDNRGIPKTVSRKSAPHPARPLDAAICFAVIPRISRSLTRALPSAPCPVAFGQRFPGRPLVVGKGAGLLGTPLVCELIAPLEFPPARYHAWSMRPRAYMAASESRIAGDLGSMTEERGGMGAHAGPVRLTEQVLIAISHGESTGERISLGQILPVISM
jgi:hypothetical protein